MIASRSGFRPLTTLSASSTKIERLCASTARNKDEGVIDAAMRALWLIRYAALSPVLLPQRLLGL
jgi:hypothetical protein